MGKGSKFLEMEIHIRAIMRTGSLWAQGFIAGKMEPSMRGNSPKEKDGERVIGLARKKRSISVAIEEIRSGVMESTFGQTVTHTRAVL